MSLQENLQFSEWAYTCVIVITSIYMQTQIIYIDLNFT